MKTELKDRKERFLIHASADNELMDHEFFVGSYNGWLIAIQAVSIEFYTDFNPTYLDKPLYTVRIELHGTKVNKGGKLGEQTLKASATVSSTNRVRTELPVWLINLIRSNQPAWWNGDLGGMVLRKALEVHKTADAEYFVWMKP